jgi:hypothetical protein
VLIAQTHSRDDDLAHIQALIPDFRDHRYIRIHGKPLFLVYRTDRLPDPRRTDEIWRSEAALGGIGDLFLAGVESHEDDIRPAEIGFDVSVEFAPDWRRLGRPRFSHFRRKRYALLRKMGLNPPVYFKHNMFDYRVLVDNVLAKPIPEHTRFLGVMPSRDNMPRRTKNAYIFDGSTPER